MTKIVAVSGGVDSVVLLDMLAKEAADKLVVAHFDHGIRKDSDQDARFVAGLADKYGLIFETTREELGKNASEEQARNHRYNFLRTLAAKYEAAIITAHHKDDMVESIAINLSRGTGWRGVAVLGDPNIERPLIKHEKSEIYDYAVKNNLEFVEDETNRTGIYLRNRLRSKTMKLTNSSKDKLYSLWKKQTEISAHIHEETANLLKDTSGSRYFYTMIGNSESMELLRAELLQAGKSLTHLQRQRLSLAIKTARAGTVYEGGDNTRIEFTSNTFVVKQ